MSGWIHACDRLVGWHERRMKHSPEVFQWDRWIAKKKVDYVVLCRVAHNYVVCIALCFARKFIWIGGLRKVLDDGSTWARKVRQDFCKWKCKGKVF